MIEAAGSPVQVLPLGGCGEVGLNATLLVCGDRAILVDCGALLGVHDAPGVEKAVPGFEPLYAQGRRLEAVVLTHGHEDHIGALPALLADLDVPVFGTPTTLDFVRSRLERDGAPQEARAQRGRLVEVPTGGKLEAGPFAVEMVRVSHSIPDSVALSIDTPAGRVLHSGDFRLDPTPAYGPPTDTERLRALGDEGVALLLADSTNSERPGHGTSESEVASTIRRLAVQTTGRVVVTLFASHLHRIRAAVDAAIAAGRRVAVVGRTLERSFAFGVARGILPSDPALLVRPERVGAQPRDQLLVIASGSQGEWQGGLHRIAKGEDAGLRCLPGDRVVISARTIPGREPVVRKLVNLLLRQGVEVVTDRMMPVHCSGHASAGEQAEMLRLIRPRHFVPIHGDRGMLEGHARIAREVGVAPEAITVIEDGQSVMLDGRSVARGPDEEVSRRALDGGGRILDWGDVRERNRIGRSGLVACSVVLDRSDRLVGRPTVTLRGLRASQPALARITHAVQVELKACEGHGQEARDKRIRTAVRRACKQELSVTPVVEVHQHVVDRSGEG